MKYPYLTGDKIILKSISENDVDALLEIENQSSLIILGDDEVPYPRTKESLLKFIHTEDPERVFGIYLKENNQIVGNISIYHVDLQNLNCEIGLSISENYQNLGIGFESIKLVIDFIFYYLPMEKIKLQVFSFNKKAIKLYEKLGFQHEGSLRNEIFRFGKFQNLENYSILRDEWKETKKGCTFKKCMLSFK
ncbi:GNAT family N-acetyltransferase [Isobaculum melis]|uniref:Protein N-acetyltransferase, RimJ/RimL family n=1 Tax=Isobaculum melis TaxID=142588 RepID=A0A1H9TT23_9LACT|nr:GNAT family protein [Isobaculum melis]SES00184.1 Protein N-acetyltransferase, RimJ/RimL family [Isobaculum melis]